MANPIVTVTVSVQTAPPSSTLQQSGAALSQGATNTAPGTLTLLTASSSLTPILNGSKAVTSISQTTGTATATTTSPHGFTTSDTIELTIAGSAIAAYNGTFLCTITGASTFTYAVPSGTASPATGTIVYTVEDVAELLAMVTTFFAQGSYVPMQVLELGAGNVADGVTFLTNWINLNPGVIYSYLVPRTWDNPALNSTFLSFLASFENPTSKTYFWNTTTLATYTQYTALEKCLKPLIEAPAWGTWAANVLTALSYSNGQATGTTTSAHGVAVGQWFQISGCTPTGYNGWWQAAVGTTGSTLVWSIATNPGAESVLGTLVASYFASAGIPSTEFSRAAGWWRSLSFSPNGGNLVPPYNFGIEYGVTAFPAQGTGSLTTTLLGANIELVWTGAEGGINNTIIRGPNFLDGNAVNYWYSIDYAQLNSDIVLSNAVINGSNTPANPLYLSQAGINSLQAVLAQLASTMVAVGLAVGTPKQVELTSTAFAQNLSNGLYNGLIVVNAVPFTSYYALSPGDYTLGKYAGFTMAFAPQLGFEMIVFNIIATGFVA